jgi:hypothetical protein
VPPDSSGHESLTLLVAAFLSANHGVPFCAACIARAVKADEVRIADATATLGRSGAIRHVRYRCAGCASTQDVLVAVEQGG